MVNSNVESIVMIDEHINDLIKMFGSIVSQRAKNKSLTIYVTWTVRGY